MCGGSAEARNGRDGMRRVWGAEGRWKVQKGAGGALKSGNEGGVGNSREVEALFWQGNAVLGEAGDGA